MIRKNREGQWPTGVLKGQHRGRESWARRRSVGGSVRGLLVFGAMASLACGALLFAPHWVKAQINDPNLLVIPPVPDLTDVQDQNYYLVLQEDKNDGTFYLFSTPFVQFADVTEAQAQVRLNGDAEEIARPVLRIDIQRFREEEDDEQAAEEAASIVYGDGEPFLLAPTSDTRESTKETWETWENLTDQEQEEDGEQRITVQRRFSLERDMLRVEMTITNNTKNTHTVGLRMGLNNDVGATAVDANGQITPPVLGGVYVIPGFPLISQETELESPGIPAKFFVYEDPNTSTIGWPHAIGLAMLSGESATPPDKVQFVNVLNVDQPEVYEYEINEGADLADNSAILLYWKDRPYRAKESRTFVTYFGLGKATEDLEPNPVVALELPQDDVTTPENESVREIQAAEGDDPSTSQVETFYHSPSKFTVTGYVYNTSRTALGQTSLLLAPHGGLSLAEDESGQHLLGSIPAFSEKKTTWDIEVSPDAVGEAYFDLTGSAAGGVTKVVRKTVYIAGLPRVKWSEGLHMVSFPYGFKNPDPAAALYAYDEKTKQTSPISPLILARYDTASGGYDFYPEGLKQLEPGFGYWMRMAEDTTVALQKPEPISTSSDFIITLRKGVNGWNQIGTPFTFGVFLGTLQVVYRNEVASFEDAVSKRWIRGVLYSYNEAHNINSNSATYTLTSEEDAVLEPYVSYWIKSYVDGYLSFAPTAAIRPNIAAVGPPASKTAKNVPGNWSMRLIASAGDKAQAMATLGEAPGCEAGYDRSDLELPPEIGQELALTFPHTDWGVDNGDYTRDMRPVTEEGVSWEFDVVARRAGSGVTLTWPDLGAVPRYRMVLTDAVEGKSIYMRTSSSYAYHPSAAGERRRFKVTVTSALLGALRVHGLSGLLGPDRALRVSFTLSEAATVNCFLRSPTGRTVAELLLQRPCDKGLSVATWNGQTHRGQAIAPGNYVIEVVARSESGQVVRAVKAIRFRR